MRTIWEPPKNLSGVWYSPQEEHPLLEQARIRAEMGALVKLWHDDVRHPPDDSWLWARSNADAKAVLVGEDKVDVISMDHYLGGSSYSLEMLAMHHDFMMDINGEESGVELAEFIGRNDLYPAEIVVHSMNPVGAGNIVAALQKWSSRSTRTCLIKVEPFFR